MPTMMRDAAISFPMLGGLTLDFPASFELFGHTFYLYGVVMAIAFIAAVFYAAKRAPRVGIKGDDIFGLVLWVLPIAIVGCRIYYVIAEWDRYRDNFWDVFKIWEGGIAMYGGTIAGVLTVIVWSHVKKIRFGATLDAASSGLILGQVIGRWANFVNREAFGSETDIFCRMGLTTPDGTTYYVHPTFLYESLWNLVGFIIIDRYWYRKDHRKYDGQIFLFYVFWYGLGRGSADGQPVHTGHEHPHLTARRRGVCGRGAGRAARQYKAPAQADLCERAGRRSRGRCGDRRGRDRDRGRGRYHKRNRNRNC